MKKLLLGLIAIVLFSTTGNAQTISDATKTSALNAQMLTIVNASKAFYSKGQNYDDFLQSMSIPSPTFPSQDEFFRKVYSYVSTNTADCDIVKGDNSALLRFALDLSNSSRNIAGTSTLFGKKKWWQNLIEAAANIALDIFVPLNTTTIVIWEP